MKNFITFIAIFLSAYASAQVLTVTPEKQQLIKEYIDHFDSHDQLMGNVSIFDQGTEIINITFGEPNILANQNKTRKYFIGSITKMFTGLVYAKLSENNQIDLNDKLSQYFPEMPNAEKISLDHMLRHTSGLQDYVVKEDSLFYWLEELQTTEDILAEIIRQDVIFQPGDSMSYSNSAYYLLGKILEQKLKQPYKQIITEQITEPYGLTQTVAAGITDHVGVNSYERKADKWTIMKEFSFPNACAAGDIASNAHDLNTLLAQLFQGQVVSPTMLDHMLPEKGEWFGAGIMMAPFNEIISYGHGGDTYGTHSGSFYNPKNDLAISYILNGGTYPTNDFAIGLLSIIYDEAYELPEFASYKADASSFSQYLGTYATDELPIDISFRLENGALIAQGTGQPSFAMIATGKHIFEYLKAGLKVEFLPTENKMILIQGGQEFEMIKKVEPQIGKMTITEAVKLNSSEEANTAQDLTIYFGNYGSNEVPITIRIYEENGALYGHSEGQQPLPLTSTGGHKFEFAPAGIKIEFQPEEKLFILNQGGQEYQMIKI